VLGGLLGVFALIILLARHSRASPLVSWAMDGRGSGNENANRVGCGDPARGTRFAYRRFGQRFI
jgi:hypothetical protein